MSKPLLLSSAVVGIIAMIFIIVALATPSWMKACMNISDMLNVLSPSVAGQSISSNPYTAMFQGKHMCYDIGLFKIAMSIPGMFSTSLAIPSNAMNYFVNVTAGVLIVGLVLLFIGIVFVVMSGLSASMSSRRKASAYTYARIGLVCMMLGASFTFGGTVFYTASQRDTVHNPMAFFGQVGSALQESFGKMMGGGSMPSSPFDSQNLGLLGNRKRRQSPPEQEYGGLEEHVMSSEEQSIESDFSHFDMSGITKIMKMLDPNFAYSFYLAWVATVLALIAAALSALAYRNINMENPDMQRVPMV